jgi:hypothetical protein
MEFMVGLFGLISFVQMHHQSSVEESARVLGC